MNRIREGLVILILAAALTPGWSAAEELGRLFYTPQERGYLEQLRRLSPEALALVPERHQEIMALPEQRPAVVTMEGVVTRGGGAPVVWLNGVSYKEADLPGHVRVLRPVTTGRIEFRVSERGKAYSLRPGQALEVESGQVREAYEQKKLLSTPDAAPGDEVK